MIRAVNIDETTPRQLATRIGKWRRQERGIPAADPVSLADSLLRKKFSDRQILFEVCNESDGQPLAHVVARLSPSLLCPAGQPLGMLGFFRAQVPAPVPDLLKRAVDWLRKRGAASIVGPLDGDTWHAYRLNIGPWDQPPFLTEPENPSWYSATWEAAGFEVIDRYHSKWLDDLPAVVQATAPALDRATASGYRFRQFQISRFEDELDAIYQISLAAFRDNFLFDEIEREEFFNLYRSARSIVDPRLVWIALSPSGTPAGFLFCFVDYWQAASSMRGQRHLLAKLRFWWNRSRARAVNFKSIGVHPEHRRQSLAGALMHHGYRATSELGFQRANLCLIRDGNVSSQLDGGVARILRRYVLYQSPGSHFPVV